MRSVGQPARGRSALRGAPIIQFAVAEGREDLAIGDGSVGKKPGMPGVPGRRLTPLARDVLWELQEAGSEEMQTFRVTLPC